MAEQKGGSLAHQLLPGTELHALEGLADCPKTEDAVEMLFDSSFEMLFDSSVGGSFRDGSFRRLGSRRLGSRRLGNRLKPWEDRHPDGDLRRHTAPRRLSTVD